MRENSFPEPQKLLFLQRRVCLMGWSNRERGVATSHSQSHQGSAKKRRFSDRDYVIFAVLGLTPAIPAKRVHSISFHKGSFHKNRNQQREVANFHFSHNAVLEGGLVVLWELEPAPGSPWVYVAH